MPETDPSITPPCVACGSDAVIEGAAPSYGGSASLKITVYTRPKSALRDSLVGRKSVASDGSARVCGDCGYVMVYADDPRTLWDGYIDQLANDLED
ncbi:hypothetical protein [Rubrivirga sp.]|uniref:hypothetical protein n=1 Tax=Rubrivirga sp. TaxID=1885344 RepID=UPI003C773217